MTLKERICKVHSLTDHTLIILFVLIIVLAFNQPTELCPVMRRTVLGIEESASDLHSLSKQNKFKEPRREYCATFNRSNHTKSVNFKTRDEQLLHYMEIRIFTLLLKLTMAI